MIPMTDAPLVTLSNAGIRRNGRWLVQDRTGNYLMQNQCSLPR